MTAPVAASITGSASLADLESSIVDSAVEGALSGGDDPNEGPSSEEVATADSQASKADAAEAAAEGRTPNQKLKIAEIQDEGTTEDPKPSTRNADGTFKSQKEAPKAAKPVEAPPATPEPAEPAAEAPKREPVKLAIDFKAYGENDEELDPQEVVQKIKGIEIPWKDGTRRFSVDALGRLAQAGMHNQERDESARDAIAKHQTLSDENTELRTRIKKQNEFVAKLLDDDDFRTHYREQWQQHNTPEARAERAERERDELRQQLEGQAKSQSASSFYRDDVQTPIASLRQQYPTVTEAELEAQLNNLTAHLGQEIQPKDFPTVKSIVRDVLPAIAASIHETRSSRVEGEKQLRQVRESNTLLKKQIAQGARPVGRTATAGEAKAPRKEPRTVDERIEAIIDDELAVGF